MRTQQQLQAPRRISHPTLGFLGTIEYKPGLGWEVVYANGWKGPILSTAARARRDLEREAQAKAVIS